MAKLVVTLTIVYEADEEYFPDGVDETDILNETGLWRNTLKRDMSRNGLKGDIEDVTVELLQTTTK